MSAPGFEQEQALRNSNFSDEEVAQWKGKTSDSLYKGGFSEAEVNDYFGKKPGTNADLKAHVKENLEAFKRSGPEGEPKVAGDFFEALQAGLEGSSGGLITRGELPDIQLPEHAGTAMNFAAGIGQTMGDLPAMFLGGAAGQIAGTVAGASVGSAIPGIGTELGALALGKAGRGFGAFALPAGIKKYLIEKYKNKEAATPKEFLDLFMPAAWEAIKHGGIGVATAGAGELVNAASKPLGALTQTLATSTAEVATMTGVGAALEGHMPTFDEFADSALLMAAFHGLSAGTGSVVNKTMNLYAANGIKPAEVARAFETDVQLKQEMLSEGPFPLEPDGVEKVPMPEGNTSQSLEGTDSLPTRFFKPKTLEKKLEGILKPSDWEKAYTAGVDQLNPIKAAVDFLAEGEKIPAGQDPYKLFRTYSDYLGKVYSSYKTKTIDYETTKPNGEGLGPILKDVPRIKEELTEAEKKISSRIPEEDRANKDETWHKFTSFLLSKRAIELEDRQIEHGMDIEAAYEVVDTHEASFGPVAERLYEYQGRILKYGVDAGLISEKSAAAMSEMNKSYVPFYRLIEEDPLAATGSHEAANPFKKIKGSDLEVRDPIDSIFKNTAAIIRLAEKNRAKQELVKLAESKEFGETIIRKDKQASRPIEIKEDEILKILKQNGIDDVQDAEPFTIWRGMNKGLDENQFTVMREGKREVWTTTKDIAQGMRDLDYHPGLTSMWARLALRLPAQLLRLGTTMSPDFIVKNAIRDQFSAATQSSGKYVPFVDFFKALPHAWSMAKGKPTEAWQEFLTSGGATGVFGEASRIMKDNEFGVLKESGVLDKAWNVVKTGAQTVAVASELAENATRFAEFKRAGGLEGGFNEKVAAGYSSREATVDFARIGAKTKALNTIATFMNANIQGMDRFGRAAKENPGKFFTEGAKWMTVPTMLLWYANKDDSRVNDSPSWIRDNYWLFPTDKWEKSTFQDANSRPNDLRRQLSDGSWEVNNGTVYRVLKPFEVGLVFATIPERLLDAAFKEGHDLSGLGRAIVDGFTPNVVPTAARPVIEQAFNQSFFTGNQIVNDASEKHTPEYQYTEYTSETAKAIGKLIGHVPALRDIGPRDAKLSSPAVVDNYIRNWTGTLGQYALSVIDKGLIASGIGNEKVPPPEATYADWPMLKSFVLRYPMARSGPVEKFRENFDTTSKTIQTAKDLYKQNQGEEAQSFVSKHQEDLYPLGSINEALKDMNQALVGIRRSKDIKPPEKRQLMETIYYQMTEVARQGNQQLDAYRKGIANQAKQGEN